MTLEQCLAAAREIDAAYMEPVCSKVERHPKGIFLHHLRWMVQEMNNGMSQDKAMRWLGYIQGVMVGVYGVSLDEMKELSRKSSNAD